MIEGLRHCRKLLTALKLAEEVQLNLLPQEPPALPELDIAGTSIYCDDTGGDYYDYFELACECLALGVKNDFQFQEFTREGLTPGSVIRVDFGFWIADCGFQKKKTEILLWERLLAAIS